MRRPQQGQESLGSSLLLYPEKASNLISVWT